VRRMFHGSSEQKSGARDLQREGVTCEARCTQGDREEMNTICEVGEMNDTNHFVLHEDV